MKTYAKPLCVAWVLLFCITFAAEGRKIRTKHSIPKGQKIYAEAEKAEEHSCLSMASDSIFFSDSIQPAVRFYGFDKTVGSGIESFFISNGLAHTLNGLEIRITYTDMKGRQLHRRKVWIDGPIPAGETIRTDIKSWDTQKSFYFHQSAKPRRQATPFDVRITLISVSL